MAHEPSTDPKKPKRISSRARVGLESIPTFAPLLAPATLTLTGILYLAGWSRQAVYDYHFGLKPSLFEPSLQRTLVEGYPPVIGGLVFVLIVAIWFWFWLNSFRKSMFKIFSAMDARYTEEMFQDGIRWNFYFWGTVVLVGFGIAAGALFGFGEARELDLIVTYGCNSSCFRYRVDDREWLGRIVEQDSTRTAIFTTDGLQLVETAKINRVRFETFRPEPPPVPRPEIAPISTPQGAGGAQR